MTIIDGNSDSQPDGIINLYDEYNGLTGLSTSLATGTWFDPDFNFALDETTGELYLWDLDNSSKNIDDYQFQLIDTNSSCTGGVIAIINVVLGPFSGFSIPATGVNDVNVEICDANFGSSCVTITEFDLFQTLLSVPSPHQNGIWTYEGSSPNFIGILEDRYLQVNIPYQQGVPLVDEDTFELVYTVEGISSWLVFGNQRINRMCPRNVLSW